jgi:PEP-CTERM motif-containing protein
LTDYGVVTWTGEIGKGTTAGVSAAPLGDASPYLYGTTNAPATVTFSHSLNTFDIYWGSIDSLAGDGRDNVLTLSNGDSLTATQLIAMIPSLAGTGSPTSPTTNAWIDISDTTAFTAFTASVGQPAFEFDMAAVPEASTWAMMVLGFAGLGFAGWRKATGPRAVFSDA